MSAVEVELGIGETSWAGGLFKNEAGGDRRSCIWLVNDSTGE